MTDKEAFEFFKPSPLFNLPAFKINYKQEVTKLREEKLELQNKLNQIKDIAVSIIEWPNKQDEPFDMLLHKLAQLTGIEQED